MLARLLCWSPRRLLVIYPLRLHLVKCAFNILDVLFYMTKKVHGLGISRYFTNCILLTKRINVLPFQRKKIIIQKITVTGILKFFILFFFSSKIDMQYKLVRIYLLKSDSLYTHYHTNHLFQNINSILYTTLSFYMLYFISFLWYKKDTLLYCTI